MDFFWVPACLLTAARGMVNATTVAHGLGGRRHAHLPCDLAADTANACTGAWNTGDFILAERYHQSPLGLMDKASDL